MSIERMAQAMKLVPIRISSDKGYEETIQALARAALSALVSGEAMEAAYHPTVTAITATLMAELDRIQSAENPATTSGIECSRIAWAALRAAAPLLLAPHLAEIERLREQVEFYRETGKAETEYQLERVDALESQAQAAVDAAVAKERERHREELAASAVLCGVYWDIAEQAGVTPATIRAKRDVALASPEAMEKMRAELARSSEGAR